MMETKTIKLRCESCGASLTAKEGKEFMYCEHCGTKIYLVAKQEIKHTYLDETEVKKAQIDAETKLKQVEINAEIAKNKEEKNQQVKTKRNIVKFTMSIILIVFYIIISNILEWPLTFWMIIILIIIISKLWSNKN